MTRIGFHCPHEQYPPGELLRFAKRAEQAGFRAGMCSDHFHPWLPDQGQAGFARGWLGAALEGTGPSFGTVCAPGDRYHPAVVAQAAATLAAMYPGRFWLAVGSGEALNEHVTGAAWPPKPERNARLRECADVMRALWAGETVTRPSWVTVRDAKLFTRPQEPRPSWPRPSPRRQPGEGRPAGLGGRELADLRTPGEFAAACGRVTRADVRERLRVSSDPGRPAGWLRADLALGFDAVYLHNLGRNQEEFIEVFAARVLPALR